jgi:hypothetical protein
VGAGPEVHDGCPTRPKTEKKVNAKERNPLINPDLFGSTFLKIIMVWLVYNTK